MKTKHNLTYDEAILFHDTKKWILEKASLYTNFPQIKKIIKDMSLEQLLECRVMFEDKLKKDYPYNK
tara:strand:- start:282 stop:482 length:201 start_codon:yes stop_codon:yes gene_type:complete